MSPVQTGIWSGGAHYVARRPTGSAPGEHTEDWDQMQPRRRPTTGSTAVPRRRRSPLTPPIPPSPYTEPADNCLHG